MTPIRILIVDDHDFFARSLVKLLCVDNAVEVIGTANTGDQAIHFCQNLRPDVVIMDLNMPNMSGLVATQQIAQAAHTPFILVLTGMDDAQSALRAFDAGAHGYLRKDALSDELLLSAIHTIIGGGFVIDAQTFAQLKRSILAHPPR